MKKIILLAGIATVALSVNARAYDWKPYISAKVSASNLNQNTSIRVVYTDEIQKHNRNSDDSQHVWGTSFAAGIASSPIRVELEWQRNTAARMSDTTVYSNQLFTEIDTQKTKIKTHAYMLNAYYDFNTDSRFTPYIGGGIGFAKAKIARARYNDDGEIPFFKLTNSHTNIAWQIGAGISYAFNDNIDLDIGYRYIDYGKVNKQLASRAITRINDELTANELYAGIRYSF